MGLTAFKKYHELLKNAHFKPEVMGFCCKPGDIIEFSNRVRLVKSFRGLQLDGYTDETVAGYNAFLLVFLTHSAIERFNEINGIKSLQGLSPILSAYQPQIIAEEFVAGDKNRRLFDFIHKRINPILKERLIEIYDGKESNVTYLSASMRHLFAHGHLTAHANGINPRKVYRMCSHLSNYLINFMDSEFTIKVEKYQLVLKSSL